jgi:glucose/mannose transport system permease protein
MSNASTTTEPGPDSRSTAARLMATITDTGWRRLLLYLALLALVVFYLAPLWSAVMTAIKTNTAFNETLPFVPPTPNQFTLESWRVAINQLSHGVINSLLLAIPATVLSATLGSFAAYGVTNVEWRYQMPIIALFVAGIFIPYQAVLVPLSRLFAILDTQSLLSPLWGLPLMHEHYASIVNLIIAHTAYGIPITFLLFRSYYRNISGEMLEAARLDGASVFSIYRNIVLPLSKPMFAVTLIYQFTQVWNDLLFALVILPGGAGAGEPVTVALTNLSGGIIQSFGLQMAGAFVAAIPTLIVYILFGDQFAKGVAS